MAKAHTTWKVLPHGSIEKLSERLWRVEGSLEGMPMKRVMAIAQRSDGTLVVHNAIAVGEAEMAEIDRWGKVAVIVVPNGFHRLDAKVFKDRYPHARVICPAGTRKKVEEVVPVDGTYDDEPGDAVVTFETLAGTKTREGVMIVRAADGTSLVFNDLIFNMPHARGFTGFVVRHVLGSSGGPRISRLSRMFLAKDKAAVRGHLERLAGTPNLARVLVAHHEVIDRDPARVLAEVAATL